MESEEIISVEKVSKKYKDVTALNKVSFKIRKNCIFGLLGSNGAGKSTMLHILIGLLDASEGEVCILGEKTSRNSELLKNKVAIVPQKISLYQNLSIFDNLYFFGKAYGIKNDKIVKRINKLSQIFKLGILKRKVKHLSGGYQRRVSLAVALIGNPEILILDEALVGIDLETKKIIIELLKKLKEKKTILITTHSISEIEQLCDYVCFLHKGEKILEGKTKEIVEEYSSIHPSKILIKFNSPETAYEAAKKFPKDSPIDLKINNRVLEINFFEKQNKPLSIINFIQRDEKLRNSIAGIEVHKPALEEIILNIIKSD